MLGRLERVLDDPRHAYVGVDVLLDCDLLLGAFLEPPAHAYVEALGVLPHDQEVDLPSVLSAQRRQPVVVQAGGAQVDVEVELEAEPQQHAREIGGVIDTRVPDGAEQDRVGLLQVAPDRRRDGLTGAHVLVGVDFVLLEIEVCARGAQHFDRLGDDLFARSVAGQDGDVPTQGSLPSRAICSAGSCR